MMSKWKNLKNWAVRARMRIVGQGDTIILERESNGIIYLGIIDCHNIKGENSARAYLEYLHGKGKKIYVQFIIISHPHKDHQIGIFQLCKWLTEHPAITVRAVMRTSILTDANNKLLACMERAIEVLKGKKEIDSELILVEGAKIDFSPTVRLEFYSPSAQSLPLYRDTGDLNHVSTLIAVVHKQDYVLLTSDTPQQEFLRIMSSSAGQGMFNKRLVGAQIPHHGSSKNFVSQFWYSVVRKRHCTAAISVGLGNTHGHPSDTVVTELEEMKYVVRRTDDEEDNIPSKKKANTADLESANRGDFDILFGMATK